MVGVIILVAIARGLGWQPQPRFVKPPIANAQIANPPVPAAKVESGQVAAATEIFWNDQVFRLAQLELEMPEPEVDQKYGEYIQMAEDYLLRGLQELPSAGGGGVAVDVINLFNRQRNDIFELRAAFAAARSKSTEAELNSPALDVSEAGLEALATNTLPADDPAVSAYLSLIERISKHEVDRLILKGKLSERFPNRNFKLPD